MEQKSGLSPRGMALCGFGLLAFVGLNSWLAGEVNLLRGGLLVIGAVMLLAGMILLAARH